MNPGRVNISLKTKIRREEREAASVRWRGQLGAQKETEYQPEQKIPVCLTKTSKNHELNNRMPDDPIEALMNDTPWWFTAFKNVHKLIPELGQGHSSRNLDKLTPQGDPFVPLDRFLRPVERIKQQSAVSPTQDTVYNLSPGPARENYDIAETIYSHVLKLTYRRPSRTGEEGSMVGEGETFKETIVQNVNINPVMHFTLEEEFKVIDMIVRMEDYTVRNFAFMEKNFGSNCFPGYSQLTTANAACTNFSGKLPYNPDIEQHLITLGGKYTHLNFDIFFNEMRFLSANVKEEMLKHSFPAGLMILYAILEYNNNMQPQPFGQKKTQQIRMADLERFTSPWALDYADEVKFDTTIRKVGEVLRGDLQLTALYAILTMITPWQKEV